MNGVNFIRYYAIIFVSFFLWKGKIFQMSKFCSEWERPCFKFPKSPNEILKYSVMIVSHMD